jgi:REP element-mobilizing transposase RayT
MVDTPIGTVLREVWLSIPEHHPGVDIGPITVMPDHMHGIIYLTGSGPLLPTIVRSLKSEVTKLAHQQFPALGRVWQRNYYEHVIRSRQSEMAIRTYIANNPHAWITRYGTDMPADEAVMSHV